MQPRLLICDEVVSALDVSIQGQILNLLLDLRKKHNMSFLFIAHDLKVACYFCDRIGVMYRGELMEEAPAAELYRNALHPYTKLLFESALHSKDASSSREKKPERYVMQNHNSGCAFTERCTHVCEHCTKEKPALREIAAGHLIRCFMPNS